MNQYSKRRRVVSLATVLIILVVSQPLTAQENGVLTLGLKNTLWDVTENIGDRYYGLDYSIGYNYPLSLGEATILKVGLTLGVNNGIQNSDTRSVTSITPEAALKWKRLSAMVGFSQAFFFPKSTSSLICLSDKALKFWAKDYYGPDNGSSSYFSYVYDKISYTIPINETISVTPSVESEIAFAPQAGVMDVRPGVAFRYGPLMVNTLFSVYFLPKEDSALDTSTYIYLDGGIRYSLACFIKGLALGFNGSFPITKDLEGMVLQPRVYYNLGGLSLMASFRFTNVDNDNTAFSPFLKCSYSVKL